MRTNWDRENYRVYPALGSLTPAAETDTARHSKTESTRDTAQRRSGRLLRNNATLRYQITPEQNRAGAVEMQYSTPCRAVSKDEELKRAEEERAAVRPAGLEKLKKS